MDYAEIITGDLQVAVVPVEDTAPASLGRALTRWLKENGIPWSVRYSIRLLVRRRRLG